MVTKVASEFFDTGSLGLPIVDRPTNAIPAAAEVVGSQKPTLTSSGYSSLYGKPMAAAEFIVYDATGTIILQQSGVLTPVGGVAINSWQVPVDLPLNTTYQWKHKFKSAFGEDYIESALTTFTVPTATVGVPTILSPLEGSTPANLDFDIQGTPFATLGISQNHDETTVEIATTSDFLTGLQTVVKNTGDLTVVNVSVPTASTVFYMRMKYRGDVTGYSSVSETVSIVSVDNSIATPSILSPENFATGVQQSFTATSSAFGIVGEAQTHVASEWEVYNNEALTSLFYTTGESATKLISAVIQELVSGSTYYIRKRDKGSITGFSDWSALSQFDSAANFATWNSWDGTNDGVAYKASAFDVTTSRATQRLAGRMMAELSFEKFISTTNSNGNNGLVHVVGVDGLVVGSGTSSLTATVGSIRQGVCKVSDSQGLTFAPNGNVIYLKTMDLDGSNLIPGISKSFAVGVMSNLDVTRVSDTQAVAMYNYSATDFRARVLDIAAGVITLGAEYTIVNFRSMIDGHGDSLGNKVLVQSFSSTTIFLEVLEANLSTSTLSQLASTNMSLFAGSNAAIGSVIWLNENTIVGIYRSSNTKIYLVVWSYDGGSVLDVETQIEVESTSSVWEGVGLSKIDSENVMLTYSSSANNAVYARHVKVKDYIAFLSLRIDISGGVYSGAAISEVDVKAVDSSRVIASFTGDANDPGMKHQVLNGLI